MIVSLLKFPLLVLYFLCCTFIFHLKDSKQRKTLLLSAVVLGGLLAL